MEMQVVQTCLGQIDDTVRLIKNTVNPEVFFKRISMAYDLLLHLQKYEKLGVFVDLSPTEDLKRLTFRLGGTVNLFVIRALKDNEMKVARLKTKKAQEKQCVNFAIALISAFDVAPEFWQGNGYWPHYKGPLYTQENYKLVEEMYYALDEYDIDFDLDL